jgi:hypothetical protein
MSILKSEFEDEKMEFSRKYLIRSERAEVNHLKTTANRATSCRSKARGNLLSERRAGRVFMDRA